VPPPPLAISHSGTDCRKTWGEREESARAKRGRGRFSFPSRLCRMSVCPRRRRSGAAIQGKIRPAMSQYDDDTPVPVDNPRRRYSAFPDCVIVVENGPEAGRLFGPLREGTTIGRDPSCAIQLNDPRVLDRHCDLTWTDEGYRFRDLGSDDLWYCGIRIHDATPPIPCRFHVGSTTLLLELQDGPEPRWRDRLDPCSTVLGASGPMRRLFHLARRLAESDNPVLLLGETGTGKSAIAEAIHRLSPRKDRPFVCINCRELREDSIHAKLFGELAAEDRYVPGLFEQAAGGSVLLDHIADLPYNLQPRLFEVLETGIVRPSGGAPEVHVEVRLFSATSRNLRAYMDAGRFRKELYSFIEGVGLVVPPLRSRISDVKILAEWFGARSLSPEAVRLLEQYAWPGNVRQLQEVIAHAVLLARGSTIEPDNIVLDSLLYDDGVVLAAVKAAFESGHPMTYAEFEIVSRDHEEPRYLERLLAVTGGDLGKAVELSGLEMNELLAMLKKYGM
jgi:two-component system, NtrC family, response regulator GlrR